METRSLNSGSGKNVSLAVGPNICRICLIKGAPIGVGGTPSKGMESIFATIGEYEEKSMYGILVTICAPLGQRDMLNGMPERICRSCKWRLLSAYELYETCLRSDEKMRGVADTKDQQQLPEVEGMVRIKQEVQDQDEHDNKTNVTADVVDPASFLMDSHYYPEAESTLMMNSRAELLEEMTPTVDPNETLFEEHYKLNEQGSHCCGICDQEFPYKSQCRTHIIVKHDPAKPWKCDVCFYTLTTELRLIRHKAISHGVGVIKIDEKSEEKDEAGDVVYTCKICSKTFATIVRFRRHKNVHVVYNRPFKCDICLYRFPNRAQLTQHSKSHQEKSAESESNADLTDDWKCDYCEEKFPGKRALTMHTRKFHQQELQGESKEKNEYKCIICSEEFARESVLNTHLKMHELMAFEKEKGQRQELEFLMKKELQKSSSEADVFNDSVNESQTNISSNAKKKSDADMVFVCMVCEDEFEERETLLKHQKKLHKELQLNIVSGGQEDSAPQPESTDDARGIDSTSAMEKEDEESTSDTVKDDDEPMIIDMDPNELLVPMNSENGTPKRNAAGAIVTASPGPPKCDLCQKTFQYNCLLQTHLKQSHNESKPFECKVCHMRFGYRGTLQKHELIHSAQNIRPGSHGSIMYKCKICFAKFLELKALTNHLKGHRPVVITVPRKVEIFQCTFCPQIFNGKEQFEEHVTKDHRQLVPKQQSTPVQQQQQSHHHSRKNPDPRRIAGRQPMDAKELFFDSLSIVKLEHITDTT